MAKNYKALIAAIEAMQDKAHDAVGHVGAANYAEREHEAQQWVRDAAENVRKEVNRLKRQKP